MFSLRQFDAAMQAGHLDTPAAPVVTAPLVARYKAVSWYMDILGKYYRVATAQQIDHARYITSADDLPVGMEITHVGPSFAELDAALLALAAVEAPPAEFVAAVVEAIGPVAELGPGGPVDLAAYLASFADDQAEPTYTDAEMDRMALDAAEMDTLAGYGRSDAVWDAYPETWHGRVMREIDAAEAAIKAALALATDAIVAELRAIAPELTDEMIAAFDGPGDLARLLRYKRIGAKYGERYTLASAAPCCSPAEALPCLGCVESFADDLIEAVSSEPLYDRAAIRQELDEAFGPATAEALTPEMLAVDAIPPGRYTLAGIVRASGLIFARWNNAAGDLVRDTLAGLADRIVATGAKSVHEFDRLDALDRIGEAELAEARGWRVGHDAALREVFP